MKAERVDHSSHIELEVAVSWQSWNICTYKHIRSQEDFSCGCQLQYCRRPTRSGSSSSTASGEDTEEETED